VLALAAEDPAMLVWWGSEAECASALARIEREAVIDATGVVAAFSWLQHLKAAWHEIIRAMLSEKRRHGLYVCTRCAPPMRCNSAPPLLRQKGGRHHWNSSRWTTASARLHERRVS
jgi:hypothetical protein